MHIDLDRLMFAHVELIRAFGDILLEDFTVSNQEQLQCWGEYSYEYDIGKETIDQYRNFSALIVKISNHWKHNTYTKYNTLAPMTPSSSPPRSKTKRKFQLFVSPSK